jgi:hypothetical protein
MGEMRKAYIDAIGEQEGKKELGRSRLRGVRNNGMGDKDATAVCVLHLLAPGKGPVGSRFLHFRFFKKLRIIN